MSVQPRMSPEEFDDELERTIYEYVERNGAVEPAELARAIRIESGTTHSKPARSGTYTESICPPAEDLESCVQALTERGYLTESDGKIRLALGGTPTELALEDATVTVRPAREEDREGIVETMREVADEGPYIVAENVATQLERDSALVRANEERSRVCFVASLESESDEGGGDDESDVDAATGAGADTDSDVVGWLHLDAHELPSLSHTAELTLGVAPAFRREGIGSSLLEYGLEWAGDAGYRKCYQNLPATNETAVEFLEDNGWRREGVHEEQYRIDDEYVDEVMLAAWP
ncbi:GCN5-related N-acetyltransferase [Haloterrigena turkmenica DSM 5511]|uniref:GCN5-related N-acetyltransferase n=1 Tax=Haloterrigena turkmenica (strain ATCC 51198 / DSM 5511 / JCM 9101 / NCIMB 13204 / VKM B-1734 / 4k) TaxID=543526 RepID=D2RWY9_HALTV|nr:GNAT family N-acetyltransferase [Haloterrigena turkmenica]ADB59601.1 GCN5-related N-acetyltransferase [Haloterrigena turkmenica DSM 5511]